MTVQETIDKAVAWAVAVANDPTYGYDQANRWGPNYDCSSFVISAYQYAGVPVRAAGASYTGNMLSSFLKCGFRNVANSINLSTGSGLCKGDVLLHANHTELYIGDGKDVKASINERGGTTGGQSGDQSGREIYIGPYYNYPWSYVLRYVGDGSEEPEKPVEHSAEMFDQKFYYLRRGDGMGDRGWMKPYVKAMQILLNGNGCNVGPYGTDGEFGPGTEAAVLAYQRRNGLTVDGVYGPQMCAKLHGFS